MRKQIFVVAIAVMFLVDLGAQGVISTDRPTQTYGTSVLGKGVVVLETGMLFNTSKLDNGEKIHVNDYATTYLRIGTGANLEFQIGSSFSTVEHADSSQKTSGLTPIKLGSKFHIASEKGAWPEISFIGNITLPWIGEEQFRPDFIAPDFRFIFFHTLSERFSLAYNLGMAWTGFEAQSTFVYTLVLGATLIENLSGFVEVFGYIPEKDRAQHAFDLGLTYLLSSDVQLDISYGLNYSGMTSQYFNFGVAFQFGDVSN